MIEINEKTAALAMNELADALSLSRFLHRRAEERNAELEMRISELEMRISDFEDEICELQEALDEQSED